MPRALEALDSTLRSIEQGELSALEALEQLLGEELTMRETRRIKIALMTARLGSLKTLDGFDFSFQPSFDRNRILAFAELAFIARHASVATTCRYLATKLQMKRDALDTFWNHAGIESAPAKPWKPRPDLLAFLQSL